MKTSLVLAVLLLTGTTAGTAWALSRADDDLVCRVVGRLAPRCDAAHRSDSFRVADDHHRDRDRHGRRHHRDHDEDDDDDDRGAGAGAPGRMPAAGPSDPATPVPDNGLFQGKARPKVEVN